ncbi:MAG: hypothetical protein U0559_04625 [Anaerolineae bacterium]
MINLGSVATMLVQDGTLKVGDGIVVGNIHGRVRTMQDDKGKPIQKALPSTPVLISRLAGVPAAGDQFEAVSWSPGAIVAERQSAQRNEAAAAPCTAPCRSMICSAVLQAGE